MNLITLSGAAGGAHADQPAKAAAIVPLSYTPTAAAAVTGRSRSRIFKALKDRELTGRKDGRATLIEADELRRWLRTMPAIGRPLPGGVEA